MDPLICAIIATVIGELIVWVIKPAIKATCRKIKEKIRLLKPKIENILKLLSNSDPLRESQIKNIQRHLQSLQYCLEEAEKSGNFDRCPKIKYGEIRKLEKILFDFMIDHGTAPVMLDTQQLVKDFKVFNQQLDHLKTTGPHKINKLDSVEGSGGSGKSSLSARSSTSDNKMEEKNISPTINKGDHIGCVAYESAHKCINLDPGGILAMNEDTLCVQEHIRAPDGGSNVGRHRNEQSVAHGIDNSTKKDDKPNETDARRGKCAKKNKAGSGGGSDAKEDNGSAGSGGGCKCKIEIANKQSEGGGINSRGSENTNTTNGNGNGSKDKAEEHIRAGDGRRGKEQSVAHGIENSSGSGCDEHKKQRDKPKGTDANRSKCAKKNNTGSRGEKVEAGVGDADAQTKVGGSGGGSDGKEDNGSAGSGGGCIVGAQNNGGGQEGGNQTHSRGTKLKKEIANKQSGGGGMNSRGTGNTNTTNGSGNGSKMKAQEHIRAGDGRHGKEQSVAHGIDNSSGSGCDEHKKQRDKPKGTDANRGKCAKKNNAGSRGEKGEAGVGVADAQTNVGGSGGGSDGKEDNGSAGSGGGCIDGAKNNGNGKTVGNQTHDPERKQDGENKSEKKTSCDSPKKVKKQHIANKQSGGAGGVEDIKSRGSGNTITTNDNGSGGVKKVGKKENALDFEASNNANGPGPGPLVELDLNERLEDLLGEKGIPEFDDEDYIYSILKKI